MGKPGRPKGSKNKAASKRGKAICFRIDQDLLDFLLVQTNRNRYVNNLIRKDKDEYNKEMEYKQETEELL